jgi:hypothetical protein
MKRWSGPLAAVLLVLAGCASDRDPLPEVATAAVTPDWRTVATAADRHRLREWRTAWTRALRKARASGYTSSIAIEGPLLDPDAAIDWAMPPSGPYQCRVVKMGAQAQGLLDYVSYPPFACRIDAENGLTRFVKLTGSQRPIGLMFPNPPNRMVFLGTLQLGDETLTLEYGRDRTRDLAALVERIGERRWRLVFPYPRFESLIDVMEIIPNASVHG